MDMIEIQHTETQMHTVCLREGGSYCMKHNVISNKLQKLNQYSADPPNYLTDIKGKKMTIIYLVWCPNVVDDYIGIE